MSATGTGDVEAQLAFIRRSMRGILERRAVTFTAASKELKLPVKTLRAMVSRGELLTTSVDGPPLIPLSELDRIRSEVVPPKRRSTSKR